MDCLFCKIVEGEISSHRIWEDGKHIAFLTPFPNTEGFSVVIPKEHYPSYVFDAPEGVVHNLMLASREVARLLDEKLEDVGRTGLIFEGFGVDHLHSKLFPMHGTKGSWKERLSGIDKYFEQYEGYISSHDGKRVDDKKLAEIARRIRG